MKDQYVGDVNDFYKYALLRQLTADHEGRLIVAWMRTPPDHRSDGRRLGYLHQPARYRQADPELFDLLGNLVALGRRSVEEVEAAGILGDARFHSAWLGDSASDRGRWFDGLLKSLQAGDLVFLDPDNGMAVPSVTAGRQGASRYVYWPELAAVLQDGRSACVYQHFPRRKRAPFVRELLERIESMVPGVFASAVGTTHVAFLIAGPREATKRLVRSAERVVWRLPEAFHMFPPAGDDSQGAWHG